MTDRGEQEKESAWRRYLRFVRPNPTGDVNTEIDFHLQSIVDELVAGGMSRAAAMDAAQRKFGDVSAISTTLYQLSQERERRMQWKEWADGARHDVVFGLRQLRKSPGFTFVTLLTLALGIGANSAIFSVFHAVLLRPLPYTNADRIMSLAEKYGASPMSVTYGNYGVWRATAKSFEVIGATTGSSPLTLTSAGDPAPIQTTRASSDYWRAEHIPAVLGRYFTDADEEESSARVVVLSFALWRNRFAADPSIVGKPIMLSGDAYTVVGVASPSYIVYPPAEKVWVPLKIPAARYADHSDHELAVYGLVRRGVDLTQAERELSGIERSLAKQYPNSLFDDVLAQPLADAVLGPQRKLVFTLFGAVFFVLLIACANVANLLMARAASRRAELAIRGALGASRSRLMRQLLIECLMLAIGGGVLGLVVAKEGIRFLTTSPASIPRLQDATLNGMVVWFTLTISVACAFFFGLLPAFGASRLDVQQTLRDGGREASVTSRDPARGALVVAELCLSDVLLIGAALLIRSHLELEAVSPGFNQHGVTLAGIVVPSSRYQTTDAMEAAFQRLDAAVAAIPGMEAAGRVNVAPIYGGGWDCTAMREGSNGHDKGALGSNMRSANPGYFGAIGVPLLRGRTFTTTDAAGAAPVAIVNRRLGRALYGDSDPIGRLVSGCADNGAEGRPTWRQIVGVIGDMRADGRADDAPPELYMPAAQWRANRQMTYVMRSALPEAALVPMIRKAVAGVDPMLALSAVSTMDDSIARREGLSRFAMWLLTLVGATGLVLAAVGVYGVVSYGVTQRRHEFGVRIALGATESSVRWLVMRQGAILAMVGVGLGTAAAYGLSRFLRSLIFGVTTHDLMTFVVVAVSLTLVVIVASYIPSHRATRVDPLQALRRQ